VWVRPVLPALQALPSTRARPDRRVRLVRQELPVQRVRRVQWELKGQLARQGRRVLLERLDQQDRLDRRAPQALRELAAVVVVAAVGTRARARHRCLRRLAISGTI